MFFNLPIIFMSTYKRKVWKFTTTNNFLGTTLSVSFSVLDTLGMRNAIILLVLMGAVTVISVHAERK